MSNSALTPITAPIASQTAPPPRYAPLIVCMNDIEPRNIQWLWPGRIPIGAITLIVGAPGAGKSFCLCDIAARVSAAAPWPDSATLNSSPNSSPASDASPVSPASPHSATTEPGSVILISAEDNPHTTLRRRLEASKAVLSRVHLLHGVSERTRDGNVMETNFSLERVAPLRSAIEQINAGYAGNAAANAGAVANPGAAANVGAAANAGAPIGNKTSPAPVRLVVIDPIGSYLGNGGDTHRDTTVRIILAPLAALAERYRLAVVLIAHRRKAPASMADELAMGSRAFTGVARSVLHIARDTVNRDRRLLLPGKSNLTAQTPGLAFHIAGATPTVHWDPTPIRLTADDGIALENDDPGRLFTELQQAVDWLEDQLCDQRRHPLEELKAAAQSTKHAWRTIERARRILKVHSHSAGRGNTRCWSLTEKPKLTRAEEESDFLDLM
jgi:putative DNA primase/helicase